PHPRSARDGLRLRRSLDVRGSRNDRPDARRAAVVPRSVPPDDQRAHRNAARQVLRAADRLRAAQYSGTARPRTVQLLEQPRETDESKVNHEIKKQELR